MLVYASISPHPPIIIPEIGEDNVRQVKKTLTALKKQGRDLSKLKPETIIVISPHGPISENHFNVSGADQLEGDFLQFGHPEIKRQADNDLDIANRINQRSKKLDIPVILNHNPQLDHGILVPLYYLAKDLPEADIVPINFSYLDLEIHVVFGRLLKKVIDESKKKIAVVASGDLSHGLTPDAPSGYAPMGKFFDQKMVDLIKHNDTRAIENLDPNLVNQAGECGYRSILILLGILQGVNYIPEVLSYEGPFGVGYLVANFKLS